uniref:CHK kinase-like domain-containing protein n=1 Tax=Clastoptera arizonana TaxID=38151 RepID=A0A1B6DWE1_9HEMI
MSRIVEIERTIFQDLMKKKWFGEDFEFISYEVDPLRKLEQLKNSDMIFVSFNLKNDNNVVKKHIFVKFEPKDEDIKRVVFMGNQFYNEIYCYESILPFLMKEEDVFTNFPKFYSGSNNPNSRFVVLEDISEFGYKMTNDFMSMDLDHVKLTLTQLGKFHAMSYAAKLKHPKEFFTKVTNTLMECNWVNGKDGVCHIQVLVKSTFERTVESLRNKYPDEIKQFFDLINKKEFFLDLVKPEEPISVVCHGDFVSNNMMYRYSEDGNPEGVKFIDLGMVRYSSPIIDISLYLWFNLSIENRSLHWEELLQVYHNSLSTTFDNIRVPSFVEIKREFCRKCVYGLIHTLYSIPIRSTITGENDYDFLKFIKAESPDKLQDLMNTVGGKKGTDLLTELMADFFENWYLESICTHF